MKFLTPKDLNESSSPGSMCEDVKVDDMVEIAMVVNGNTVKEWVRVVGRFEDMAVISIDRSCWAISASYIHDIKESEERK